MRVAATPGGWMRGAPSIGRSIGRHPRTEAPAGKAKTAPEATVAGPRAEEAASQAGEGPRAERAAGPRAERAAPQAAAGPRAERAAPRAAAPGAPDVVAAPVEAPLLMPATTARRCRWARPAPSRWSAAPGSVSTASVATVPAPAPA